MKFKFGFHTLAVTFNITSEKKLLRFMKSAVKRGATVCEIPYLLCKLPWETVAKIAREAGILEIVICHFWPYDDKGCAVCGDPLGSDDDRAKAEVTVQNIAAAAVILRKEGVTVRYIDGPFWGGLGKTYSGAIEVLEAKMVSFMQTAGRICQDNDLIMVVEFLRPGEGTVIKGTKHMVSILEKVNNECVKMHFDTHHSHLHGENIADSILFGGKWIAHLHLHGEDRRMPGQKGDSFDWPSIIQAVNRIDSGVKYIVVVCEPFGKATCKANKVLGQGMPDVPSLAKYLKGARGVFERNGLEFAA